MSIYPKTWIEGDFIITHRPWSNVIAGFFFLPFFAMDVFMLLDIIQYGEVRMPFALILFVLIFTAITFHFSLLWEKIIIDRRSKQLVLYRMRYKSPVKETKIDLSKYKGVAWGKFLSSVGGLNFIHEDIYQNIYGLHKAKLSLHEDAEIKAKEFAEFLDMTYLGRNDCTTLHFKSLI